MASILDFPEPRHLLIKRAEAAFDAKVNSGIKDGFRLRRWDGKQPCSVYWGISNLPRHSLEIAISPVLSIGKMPYRDVVDWVEHQIQLHGSRGARHKGSESWPTIGFSSHDDCYRFLEVIGQIRQGQSAPRVPTANTLSNAIRTRELPDPASPIEVTAGTLLDEFRRRIGTGQASTVALRRHAQRIGQRLLRRALIAHWSGACALTGLDVIALLRASHIKRWAESSDLERLDIHNTLLLAPQVDCAFDTGFITFDDDGRLLTAHSLTDQHLEVLALSRDMALRIPPSPSQREYLKWHRSHLYRNE